MTKNPVKIHGITDLLKVGKGYEYTIAYMMSDLLVGFTKDLIDKIGSKPDELLEARFFEEKKEMHVFYREGELLAVEVCDEANDETWEEENELSGRFKEFGKLKVKRYINFDEDGQAYVELTRCTGFVKGVYGNGKN